MLKIAKQSHEINVVNTKKKSLETNVEKSKTIS